MSATTEENTNFLSARWPTNSEPISEGEAVSPNTAKKEAIISDIVAATVPMISAPKNDMFDLDLDKGSLATVHNDDSDEEDDEDEDLRAALTNSMERSDYTDSVVDWLATESFESMDGETLKKSFDNHNIDYDSLIKNPDSLRMFLQNVREDLESRGKTMQSIDLVERLEKVLVHADEKQTNETKCEEKEEEAKEKVEEAKVEKQVAKEELKVEETVEICVLKEKENEKVEQKTIIVLDDESTPPSQCAKEKEKVEEKEEEEVKEKVEEKEEKKEEIKENDSPQCKSEEIKEGECAKEEEKEAAPSKEEEKQCESPAVALKEEPKEEEKEPMFKESEFQYVVVGIQDHKPDIFEIERPCKTVIPSEFAKTVADGYAIYMRRIKEYEKEEIRYARGKPVARQLVNVVLEETDRKTPFLLASFKEKERDFHILTLKMAEKGVSGFPVTTIHFARDIKDLEAHLSFKPSTKVGDDGTAKTSWQHFWISDSRELCVHVDAAF